MASRPSGPFILEVTFEPREDGGLRAYCDRVPNLVLSHSDPEAVLADVGPALEVILSEMYGMRMVVQKVEEFAPDRIELPPAHICGSAQYVGVRASN